MAMRRYAALLYTPKLIQFHYILPVLNVNNYDSTVEMARYSAAFFMTRHISYADERYHYRVYELGVSCDVNSMVCKDDGLAYGVDGNVVGRGICDGFHVRYDLDPGCDGISHDWENSIWGRDDILQCWKCGLLSHTEPGTHYTSYHADTALPAGGVSQSA